MGDDDMTDLHFHEMRKRLRDVSSATQEQNGKLAWKKNTKRALRDMNQEEGNMSIYTRLLQDRQKDNLNNKLSVKSSSYSSE